MSQQRDLTEINRCLVNLPATLAKPERLLGQLKRFIRANADPQTSPNYAQQAQGDDVRALAALLGDARAQAQAETLSWTLCVLKIVTRKASTRTRADAATVRAVAQHIRQPRGVDVAREACSVLLNLCYEAAHVLVALDADAVAALYEHMASDDADLRTAATGALQSICFQNEGKSAAIAHEAVCARLAKLLYDSEAKVRARACGALHNISTDPSSPPLLRQFECIVPLVGLIRDEPLAVAASAAGAIQNMSRELLCRQLARDADAVTPLTRLLFSGEPRVARAAVGALLNIVGSDFGEPSADNAPRRAFQRLLSECVELGTHQSLLFELERAPT